MPQAQTDWAPVFPAGGTRYNDNSTDESATTKPSTATAQKTPAVLPPLPPSARGNPQPAGVIATAMSEAGAPFSMKDADGNWKVPDVISGPVKGISDSFKPNLNRTFDQRVGDVSDKASAAYHAFIDPVTKMTSSDPQTKAEGFGQMISNAMQILLAERFGKTGKSSGNVPRGADPSEWSGPQPTPPPPPGPPEPPTTNVNARIMNKPAAIAGSQQKLLTGQTPLQASVSSSSTFESPASDIQQQRGLAPAPPPPRQLVSGGVQSVPAGSDVAPITPDPRLPASYANTQVGSTSGPGIMGRANLGEEGGIPKRGEQTVTPQKPTPGRSETGAMRKGTASDLLSKAANSGRTASNAVTLPNGTTHIPSSLELDRGFVIVNGAKGKYTKFPLKK